MFDLKNLISCCQWRLKTTWRCEILVHWLFFSDFNDSFIIPSLSAKYVVFDAWRYQYFVRQLETFLNLPDERRFGRHPSRNRTCTETKTYHCSTCMSLWFLSHALLIVFSINIYLYSAKWHLCKRHQVHCPSFRMRIAGIIMCGEIQ